MSSKLELDLIQIKIRVSKLLRDMQASKKNKKGKKAPNGKGTGKLFDAPKKGKPPAPSV